jgi:hypothetical protein
MKTTSSKTRKILAILALFWVLIPTLCLAVEPTAPAPANSGNSGTTPPPAGQSSGGTVTENELFPQFNYKDTTADYKTADFSGTKLAAVNALPKKDWQSTLTGIIKILLNISGGLTLLSFTVGGVMMIVSQGSGDLLEKGKKVTYYSVAGLVIIAVSYALVIGVAEMQIVTPGAGGGSNNTTGQTGEQTAAPSDTPGESQTTGSGVKTP